MSTIKEEIIKSGRYDEINKILDNIIGKHQGDFPVRIQINSTGEAVSRVNKNDVLKGIIIWQRYLDTTGEHIDSKDKTDLISLSMLIETELEMRLHNYANTLSHRKNPNEVDLEEIRAYSILNSSIDAMISPFYSPETEKFTEFTIPNGWKVA